MSCLEAACSTAGTVEVTTSAVNPSIRQRRTWHRSCVFGAVRALPVRGPRRRYRCDWDGLDQHPPQHKATKHKMSRSAATDPEPALR